MVNPVTEFENKIAEFFGAPYAVAVDSATSGLELSLRLKKATYINSPKHTYLSVPMLADKLGIELKWSDREWEDYYEVYPTVFDAAVLWKRDSYILGTYMCVSMQFQKHLSVGRCGVILLDNQEDARELKRMSHDGRLEGVLWRKQNIQRIGYHYYLQPELAQVALDKLDVAIKTPPKIWSYLDYPVLTAMDVFKT